MVTERKARVVGVNHVALEVGDIEEALAFYGRLFEFKLRGKSSTSAFIDLGDQFLALQKGRTQPADDGRHFGLVVDDKDAVRKALATPGSDRYPAVPRLSRPVGQSHRDLPSCHSASGANSGANFSQRPNCNPAVCGERGPPRMAAGYGS